MPEGMKEKEMIDLLLKRFVKDYDKTKNPEVRTRYGVFAAGIKCFPSDYACYAGIGKQSGCFA